MKKANKGKLLRRAEKALKNTYHNATTSYPTCRNEKEEDDFESWFQWYCGEEFDSLRRKPHFRNEKERREYMEDAMIDHRHELILEYGMLHSWGRGGRTVAPDGIIKQRGGGSFSIYYDLESLNAADLTRFVLIFEAFNTYVIEWNDAIPRFWEEEKEWKLSIDAGVNYEDYDGKKRVERTKVTYE